MRRGAEERLMERKFSFDDMKFVARAERVDGMLRVAIFDAWDECLLEADYPEAATPKTKGKGKAKGAAGAPADEEQAVAHLIAAFKQKVEDGEIDLA
jgi:hypothetical protein